MDAVTKHNFRIGGPVRTLYGDAGEVCSTRGNVIGILRGGVGKLFGRCVVIPDPFETRDNRKIEDPNWRPRCQDGA